MKTITTRSKAIIGAVMMMLAMATPQGVFAQVPTQQQQPQQTADYSDEQLEKFAQTTEDIMELQQEYQEKMVSAIEEEGLTPEEFQQMAQGQQSGQQADVSEEKSSAFANAMTNVMSMQQEMNQEMQSKIEENEMDIQEYQQMAMQIQQSPELSKKVDEMIQN